MKIYHWELGVLITPQLCGVDRLVPYVRPTPPPQTSSSGNNHTRHNGDGDGPTTTQASNVMKVPIPYKFHPVPYAKDETPWTVD